MKRIVFSLTVMPLMMWQCEQVKDWQDPKDGVAPGLLINPQVENLNGGAKITYTLPDDTDLLGVKAAYTLHDAVERYAYASASRNYIVLDGYGNTGEHEVALYVLDKSGNESGPVSVTINPLTPPIELIRESVTVQRTFGGVYLMCDNPMKKEVAVTLYAADSTGFLQYYDTYYSDVENGRTAFRGFDDINREFRIEMRDRWNNYAAPFDTAITPLKEQSIFGRDKFDQVLWAFWGHDDGIAAWRGDIIRCNSGSMATLTDGVLFGSYAQIVNFSNYYFPSIPNELFLPYHLTIDMKIQAKYSRFKLWQGNRSPIGSAVFPIKFSLWGTNEPRPVDTEAGQMANLQYWTDWQQVGTPAGYIDVNGTGEWMNDWEKLGEYQLIYPSGWNKYVTGMVTAADEEFIREGFDFEIDMDKTDKAFRYLRFRVEDTTTGQGQIMISEIRFWGNFVE